MHTLVTSYPDHVGGGKSGLSTRLNSGCFIGCNCIHTHDTPISLPSFYLHPEVVQLLLLHPHAWVRLSSCRLFGLLFASYNPEEVASPSTSSGVAGKTKKKRKGRKGQCQIMEYMLQDSVVKVREVAMVTNALLSNLT